MADCFITSSFSSKPSICVQNIQKGSFKMSQLWRGLAKAKSFSCRNGSQTWGFVAPAAAGITGYLVLLRFHLRCFACYQLKLLFSPSLHCSPPESTALLWQTERWKSQRSVVEIQPAGDEAWNEAGLFLFLSRGECTGGVRRGGTWKTGRVSWKMKAVWNSGTNACVPLAQLSLKLSSVHKALECKQVKSQNVQWSSCALDLILKSMTVTSRDVTSNWTFFKSSWLGGWHEDAQDQDHWSIYRRKIWQCHSSDKVLSAPPSTINPPSTLKERDKQQRTSPFDA